MFSNGSAQLMQQLRCELEEQQVMYLKAMLSKHACLLSSIALIYSQTKSGSHPPVEKSTNLFWLPTQDTGLLTNVKEENDGIFWHLHSWCLLVCLDFRP